MWIYPYQSIYLSTEGRLFHSEFTYPDTMWTFSQNDHMLCVVLNRNVHILDINVRKLGLQVCGFSHVWALALTLVGHPVNQEKWRQAHI